jgi:sulfate adenylyltransferase
MHRAHRELTVRAARSQKCHVLINPVVGMTKPGDVDHYTRVRVYKAILQKYPEGMAGLSLLPLAMRMGGPREAVWHAIIRKNFGCTHFIVGRDHAGPGKDSQGQDFYGPYDAQHLVEKFKDELDIEVVPFKMVAYVPETDEYIPADEVPQGTKTLNISGTELRRRLKTGAAIPDWFTYPDVQAILRQVHPPRSAQGFAILFSGHFNSQLVTIANALESVLNQGGQRPTTLLVPDGKYQVASADYIKHVNFVSAQVAKNGGAVIASPIVYSNSQVQDFVRQVSAVGGGAFVIHVNTPVEKAKENDRSGFYSSLNQDYEAPQNPTLIVDWSRQSVGQIVHEVVLELEKSGYIGSR